MSSCDVTFPCMGTDVRLIVEEPLDPAAPPPEEAAAEARAYLELFDARLSRFRPDSELCALNADPRDEVRASPLLRAAVSAAVWAAGQTGGLADPTLVGELERSGYARSRAGVKPAGLGDALAAAPARRPAAPNPASRWREVEVDEESGTIRRPRGLRLDSGGAGKGLAADAVAHRLHRYGRVLVDCGGDIRVSGRGAAARPFAIEIEHPFGGPVHRVEIGSGAIATSGICSRIWRREDGGFAHHLLDPATGEPAWTGLVTATALAPTALEAETLSKSALLSGPAGARLVLRRRGGAIVRDDGSLELIGPLRPVPRYVARIPAPLEVAA